MSASYGHTTSRLLFAGAIDSTLDQDNVVATVDVAPTGDFSYQASVGALFRGVLLAGREHHEVGPGFSASFGVTYRAVKDEGRAPFVLLSASLAGLLTRTVQREDPAHQSNLLAGDLRFSATLGKTFFERFAPYLAVRLFGGPVGFTYQGRPVVGSDQHHYQVGVGLVINFSGKAHLFFEAAGLGERRLSAGAGLSF